LNRLQGDVEHSARAVVAYHADSMARSLAEAERDCATTRRRLLGVTALRQGPPYPVAASTVSLLRDSPANHAPGGNSADDTKYWDSFRARLQLDSEVTPDE
jgi:hypothetical protein